MPAQALSDPNRLAQGFAESEAATTGPEWLRRIRRAALARYAERGMPTTRDPMWKGTDLSPLSKLALPHAKPLDVPPKKAEAILGEYVDRIVFVNGRFAPSLSKIPKGVTVGALSQLAGNAAVQAHLARHADIDERSLVALNTAYHLDGAFIQAGKGVERAEPLHVIHLAASRGIVHARTLIVLEPNSSLDVIQTFASLTPDPHWTNAVTEIVVGEGARLRHALIVDEDDEAYVTSHIEADQGRDSRFEDHSFLLGGKLVRSDIQQVFNDQGGESILDGLYLVDGTRHADVHTVIDHARPHCTSREFYKGILDDASHGVFYGKVFVRKDAQLSNAGQTNKNLLLSQGALVDSVPAMEINANDVKATHGSTIGRLDEDARFYLRARGLSDAAAQSLLTYAFAKELLDRVPWGPVRSKLDRRLRARLPDAAAVPEA